MHNPKTDWCYKTATEPELENRSLDWPRGGGSSSINFYSMSEDKKGDYDRWAQAGNRGWSYEDVLPLFKRSESYELGASDLHRAEGD